MPSHPLPFSVRSDPMEYSNGEACARRHGCVTFTLVMCSHAIIYCGVASGGQVQESHAFHGTARQNKSISCTLGGRDEIDRGASNPNGFNCQASCLRKEGAGGVHDFLTTDSIIKHFTVFWD